MVQMRLTRPLLSISWAGYLAACGGRSAHDSGSPTGGSGSSGVSAAEAGALATTNGGATDNGGGGSADGGAADITGMGGSNGGSPNLGGGGNAGAGATSIGGGGNANLNNVPLPACITTLLASCDLQGACTVQDVNQDRSLLRYCFADGVKVVSNKGTQCNNRDDSVYASDGSLCYSRSNFALTGHACEGNSVTWKDGAGTLIATQATTGSSGQWLQITCATGGEHALCATPGNCGWDALTGPNCSTGTCSE